MVDKNLTMLHNYIFNILPLRADEFLKDKRVVN